MSALLEVERLRVTLPTPDGPVTVVEEVDFSVQEGQVFGLAGESGSGKTMSALSLLRLLPRRAVVQGRVVYRGRDLVGLSEGELRSVRGREIAMIFQDPLTSLHPMLSIGRALTEHLRHHLGVGRAEAKRRAIELLAEVRIPDPEGSLKAYPHQFSGGMRQRIAIAVALICGPSLVIADEPTTALDVTVQAGIIGLLDRLRRENGLSVMLITHDLGVMSSIADVVSVMYAGRIVESGLTREMLQRPRHPYTAGLLSALPHPETTVDRPLVAIPGSPPSPDSHPPGCRFHPRCTYATGDCREQVPPLISIESRRLACPVDPLKEAV
ncbi:MAG: ABC transporter ATP-binding protein [Solirubrobacteraceae bacterium]